MKPLPPAIAATCVYITRGTQKQLITTWGDLATAKAQIDRVIAGRKYTWKDHFTIVFDDVKVQCHHLEDIMEIEASSLQEHEERAVDRFLSDADVIEAPPTKRELRREARKARRAAAAAPPPVDSDGWPEPNMNPKTFQEAGPFLTESQAISVVKAKGWERDVIISGIGEGAGRRLILVPRKPDPPRPTPLTGPLRETVSHEPASGQHHPAGAVAAQLGVDPSIMRRAMRKAGWTKMGGEWMIAEDEIPQLRKLMKL